MIATNWYVITGAPSSGKTSLINRLAAIGYKTLPEAARSYISELMAHHLSLEEIRHDNKHLQQNIFSLMQQREQQLNTDDLYFFDRGLPDSIAYFQFHHLDETQVISSCQTHRYKKVFYCDNLPLVHDKIRDEDEESAHRIGEYIYAAYTNLGYELIKLPAVSVEKRLAIILSHIPS